MAGIPPKEHLKKIEDDQSILGIGRLDDTLRNEDARRWFVSQEIQPLSTIASFDRTSGRYILNDKQMVVSVEDTSQDNHTLTVTHGQVWEFLGAGGSDTARNSSFRYEYSDDGGTNWFPIPCSAPYGGQVVSGAMFGAMSNFVITGSGTLRRVRIINASFVAADPSRYMILYRVLLA